MPHFYLIAWLNRKDCLKVGFRMVGITDDSGKTTGKACIRWHSLTTLLSALLLAANITNSTVPISYAFLLPLTINLSLLRQFILFMKTSTSISAIKLFKNGLWYEFIHLGTYWLYWLQPHTLWTIVLVIF